MGSRLIIGYNDVFAYSQPASVPSQYKNGLSRYGVSIMKIRRSSDRVIFIIGIPLLVRRHLYIESGAPYSYQNQCGLSYIIQENFIARDNTVEVIFVLG